MSRHRFVKSEVEGSEYFEEDGMYDDLERRVADDGSAYTYEQFLEFYGGTAEWNAAKSFVTPKAQINNKKKQSTQPNNQKNNVDAKKNVPKETNDKSKSSVPLPVPPPPKSSSDNSKLNEKTKIEDGKGALLALLKELKIEEPEYAVNVLTIQKIDATSLKSSSRDDLLEAGLHPRVIDQLQQALKDHHASTEAVKIKSDLGDQQSHANAKAVATTSFSSPTMGSSHAFGPDMLSLKDKQWKRPVRPTEAEAAALATGGGLYGGATHGSDKHLLSMVVVGHVDAGKSTLMGQLLVSSGVVATKDARRFQKEANAMGKGSFYLAWVMDEGEDERAHGVTIEVAEKVIARLFFFSRCLFSPTLRLYMLLHIFIVILIVFSYSLLIICVEYMCIVFRDTHQTCEDLRCPWTCRLCTANDHGY